MVGRLGIFFCDCKVGIFNKVVQSERVARHLIKIEIQQTDGNQRSTFGKNGCSLEKQEDSKRDGSRIASRIQMCVRGSNSGTKCLYFFRISLTKALRNRATVLETWTTKTGNVSLNCGWRLRHLKNIRYQ